MYFHCLFIAILSVCRFLLFFGIKEETLQLMFRCCENKCESFKLKRGKFISATNCAGLHFTPRRHIQLIFLKRAHADTDAEARRRHTRLYTSRVNFITSNTNGRNSAAILGVLTIN